MTAKLAGASTVLEQRTTPLAASALIVRAEGDGKRFTGHAAVFDQRTEIGDPFGWGWYESVSAGAFDKTLAEGDPRFLVDHDTRMVVARKSAGDLRLSTDKAGLLVDADLDDELSYVRDLIRNLEKRRITGMSFGFNVVRDTWTSQEVELPDGRAIEVDVRSLDELRLAEVSAVTFPAYAQTDAGLRSDFLAEVRSARGALRDSLPPREEDPAPARKATRGNDTAPPSGTRGRDATKARMEMDLLLAERRFGR